MKKFLFLLGLLLSFPCEAQTTRSSMLGYNNSTFTNCGTNCITGTQLNIWNSTIVNSAGFLQDSNNWTGRNIFNNTLRGAINLAIAAPPSAPADGDLWATGAGIFTQIGGVSYNLLSGGLSAPSMTVRGGVYAQPGYVDATGLGSAANVSAGAGVAPALAASINASGGFITSPATNSNLAPMAAGTIKGNNTGSTVAPSDLTAAQVQGVLNTTQCINFKGIGGIGDGLTDNTSIWSTAFSAMGANGGCIYFPGGGNYYSASAITKTYPSTANYSITLVGDGSDSSVLSWGSTNGLTFNRVLPTQSVHVEHLTFSTSSAGTYTAISLNSSVLLGTAANSDISNTTFRGSDGGAATNYWGTAVANVGWSAFNYYGNLFYGNSSGTGGTGISVAGNASVSPYYNIIHNVTNCNFLNIGLGFKYGTYVQGVTISQTLFVNGVTGILVPAGAVGATQLTLTADEFNTSGTQVDIEAPIATFTATGNLIYVLASQTGFLINGGLAQSTITGNSFAALSSTGSKAINISGAAAYSLINSNEFYNFANGVILGASSASWLVDANVFSVVTTPITNSGTSNRITNNTGYNPIGVSAAISTGISGSYITAGASPETHYITQSASYNATVFLGTTSICSITSNTGCTVNLGPGESYGVIWTITQPTYVKSVH